MSVITDIFIQRADQSTEKYEGMAHMLSARADNWFNSITLCG